MSGLCEAKRPGPVPRLWMICGAPSTGIFDYSCARGHSRRGETCDEHTPGPGLVGCSQCWDEGVEMPMTFVRVAL